jgi:hypothetical protein
MKRTKYLLFSLVAVALTACSDTVVTQGEEVIVDPNDPIPGMFTKRVLIEDFTGTWCGNCTRVAWGIENVEAQTDRAVVAAIHYGNDPYNYDGVEPLRAMIYPEFPEFPLPTVRLNRTTVWTAPEYTNTQQALNLTGNNCGLGLAMNSSISGGNVNLSVNIKFAEDYTNLKLVVYVLEDNLVYNQVNYVSSYEGGANPIPSYDHDHVLRTTLTDILGDPIAGTTSAGETITRNFSVPVPSQVSNVDNINFVAFVVAGNNATVNARAAHLDENQAFEENPVID